MKTWVSFDITPTLYLIYIQSVQFQVGSVDLHFSERFIKSHL